MFWFENFAEDGLLLCSFGDKTQLAPKADAKRYNLSASNSY